ncbi:MAG: radical SAM protein, partial [Deltaproteobacteria bacterium]|nr:radical SAM protein [Deltaproteobacteria bacterium]
CAFCSIGMHQGKGILSRSMDSVLKEVRSLAFHPLWGGIITDIGGATADMYGAGCSEKNCPRTSCLHPVMCRKYSPGTEYLTLLREAKKVRGVKKIFLGSGIRHDLVLGNPELLEEILVHHSGRFLRIAPEHTEDPLLDLMRKPSFAVLEAFVRLFHSITRGMKRKVELAPYLIVGHPGETLQDVLNMKKKLRALGLKTTDVQIFTPTPGTLSTAMYYAGVSPSMRPIPTETEVPEAVKRKALVTQTVK